MRWLNNLPRSSLFSCKAQILVTLYTWIMVMLLSVIPAPVAAQAGIRDLQWTNIDSPGQDGNVVVHPSDVSDIAIGNSVFYAIDVNNPRVYRSLSGGLRWEDISQYLGGAGAVLPATKIAVAPDDASIVAAAADAGTSIYLSVDGGITWGNMHMGAVAGNIIQSIAISKPYGTYNEQRDILVGTARFGDVTNTTTGRVLMLHLGSVVPAWRDLNIRIDPSFNGGEVSAVAFSPNYVDDQTIMAVASTNADVGAIYQRRTFLCMGLVDLTTSNTVWNSRFGYPVEIFDPVFYPTCTQSAGDGPLVDPINGIKGGLAIPGSFSVASVTGASRVFYAFYTVHYIVPVPANDTSNAYRIDDTAVVRATAFGTVASGTKRYSSIALSGKTLVAGEVNPYNPLSPVNPLTVPVQISLDASAASPGFTQTGYPYGQGNAKVAWSSNTLYCGTGNNPALPPPVLPDESGFSISNDSGLNWVQVSLIDTTILVRDVAVASSPQSIFLTSTSTSNIESVWRSAGEPLGRYWGRVLAIDVPSDKIIVRISQQYQNDYTLYICELGQHAGPPTYNQLWVSNDRGNAWKEYTVPLGTIDLAVVDKEVSYIALPDGYVARSNKGGLFWQNGVFTELAEINMLSLAEPDTIFVGGRHGDIAYSSNGGKNYTFIPELIKPDGLVQVIADIAYQKNSLVYAASGNIIYRWAINQSEHWEVIRTANAGRQISGMASVGGIFYGAWYDTAVAGSGAERSLAPALPLVKLEWDTIQAGAAAARFDVTPTSLRYSITETSVILWTVDTINSNVMVYFDCLAWKGPDLTMSNNVVIGCDPATGRNQEVNFTWEAICADNRYQLQIAKDTNFTLMVFDSGDDFPFLMPSALTSPSLVYFAGGGSTSPILDGIQVPILECGHAYYWRVRARGATTGDIIRSPWSEVRAFTVKAGFRVTTPYYGLQLLAPDNGCGCFCSVPVCFSWTPFKETAEYRFELSTNADMNAPLISTAVKTTAYQYSSQLNCNATYFWRVMAVQPAPSEWSAVFSFNVSPEQEAISTTAVTPIRQTPQWVWVIIGLGGVLVLVILFLIFITKREEY